MTVDEAFQVALEHYRQGNLRQAETVCEEILNGYPDNADVLHLLGIIHYELKDYDSAKKYIEKSLHLNPNEAFAYFNLANIFRDRKQFDKAITYYQKALQIKPDIADDITFYGLQKGEAAEQAKNPPKGMKFIDHTEDIHDFSDTAAFIENLDLVITVDTAVAHLAGALGKSVWTLLPFVPDWRWLLNRDDSPWYPTMKLFRQPSLGDWESVIAKVSEELQKIVEEKR